MLNIQNKNIIDGPFAKGTPTAFIIDSPFQLLCAIEAIYDFAIDDYLIVLPIEGNSRKEQLLNMLNEEHLVYQVIPSYDQEALLNDLYSDKGIFATKLPKYYERVVLGDYYALDHLALSFRYATPNAVLFYLDDGGASIDLLYGEDVKDKPTYWFARFKWRKTDYLPTISIRKQIQNKWREKNISKSNNIYTIFHDIHTHKFHVYPNKFSYLKAFVPKEKLENSIYVVGTNAIGFSQSMGMTLRQYEGLLWQKLSEIRDRYPESKIIYIPHGRDNNQSTQMFCNALNIQYKPLDSAIEYYFIKEKIYPMAIYGFGSTALFSLKKIMPDMLVVNWFVDNPMAPSYETYKGISSYYQKQGIMIDSTQYAPLPIRKRISRMIKVFLQGLRRN